MSIRRLSARTASTASRPLSTFRILFLIAFFYFLTSFYTLYQLSPHESLFNTNKLATRAEGHGDNILDHLQKLEKDVIMFLHLHKSGGSFFVDLVSKYPGQTMPRRKGGNALLFCPPSKNQSGAMLILCGNSSEALMPFWLWSARIQARLSRFRVQHPSPSSSDRPLPSRPPFTDRTPARPHRSTSSPAWASPSSQTSAG